MKCVSLVGQNPSECVSYCITLMTDSSLPCRNSKHSQLWVTIKDIFLLLSYFHIILPLVLGSFYTCILAQFPVRLQTDHLQIYTILSAAFRSPIFFFFSEVSSHCGLSSRFSAPSIHTMDFSRLFLVSPSLRQGLEAHFSQ